MMGKARQYSVLLAAMLVLFGMGIVANADSGSESGFLAKINATRTAAGLSALKIDAGLVAQARRHTADMISAGDIFHSSTAELKAAGGSGWERVGENVGRGNTVDSLHTAFMNSPDHKANILGDYNYVGIGTDSSNGYLYVTVVFMKNGSTSGTAAPTTTSTAKAGSTTSVSKKAPATTTTTMAPTTTTTLVVPPDRAVTPGESCIEAGRYYQLCQN
jgi:Cysteine-rich secretory protein family